MKNIRQNLLLGIYLQHSQEFPIAAGVLYPLLGIFSSVQ